jgi:hypothetical protein
MQCKPVQLPALASRHIQRNEIWIGSNTATVVKGTIDLTEEAITSPERSRAAACNRDATSRLSRTGSSRTGGNARCCACLVNFADVA